MADTVVRKFRRAFKYRIYPTKVQIKTFERWLELCREIHNSCIAWRRDAWEQEKVSIQHEDQRSRLPSLKREYPEFADVYAQVLQQVVYRVDFAFKAFFRRVKAGENPGYPRFKNVDRYNSLIWPQDIGFHLVGTKRVHLSGIGEVRIKLHRPVEGKTKTCMVKRVAGKWYVIFSCDEVPAREYPDATSEVGIDMGLESFATLSTGEKIGNPRWYRKAEERIAAAQRELSRKKKGSRRRQKASQRVARLHEKTANRRRDFHHKLARRVVEENSLIAVEDLKPSEMVKDSYRGHNKSRQDAGWAQFLMILEAKAEEAARRFVRVPPYGTSSTCFQCGAYRKKELSERIHFCSCGLVLDRDVHASLNILRLGRSLRGSA